MAVWTTARVTIYNSSLVSQGTIDNVTFMKGSYALNRIGDGEFVFHAYDTPAVDITKYNRIAVGEVYNTLTAAYQNVFCIYITSIRPVDQGNGVFMHVSGPNILHELTNDTLDFNLVSDGSGGKSTTWVDDILGYAANAWTSTDMGTGSTGGYLPAAEESVFDALVEVHKQNGHSVSYHPSGAPARDVVSVLQNIDGTGALPFDDLDLSQPLDPTTIQSDTTAAYIRQIEVIEDAADIVTRVYPYGAGMGRERITLAEAEGDVTVPGGFTVDWANNHITNTTLEAETDQQRVTVRKQFAHIKPETFDSADANFTAANDTAAEQIFDAAIAFLRERNSDRRKSYRVIAMCHGDYSPGQQVNLNYTVTSPIDANGAENPTAVVSVNEDIILHEIEHSWDARTGERVSTLTLSQQVFDKRTDQGEDQVIKAIKGFEEIIRHTTAWPTPIDTTDWSDIIFGDLPIGNGLDGTGPNIDLGTPGTITSTSTNTVTASSHTHAVDGTIATHDPVTLGTNLGNNLLGLSTQQLTLDSQSANTVFAAPDGSAGAPSFRALVAADIPGGTGAPDDATYVVISNTADLSAERALTGGTGITISDGGANSTVTINAEVETADLHDAVTLASSLNTNLLGLSGQQLTLDNQTGNTVFASPAGGGSGAPDFRALVAADIPSGVTAPPDATYVVISTTTDLSAERSLNDGNGITLSDGGANNNVTLALGTPSTLTVSTSNGTTASSHTHAITSSSDVTAASILASDSNGRLGLEGLGIGTAAGSDNITVADNVWIGLGASAGRIEFDNLATDEVNIRSAKVGINTATPDDRLHVVDSSNRIAHFESTSSSGYIYFSDSGTTSNTHVSIGAQDNDLVFRTGNAITMYLDSAGRLLLNENSSLNNSQGLTIQQGTADDEILSLKSTDVAHGMTGVTETENYGRLKKETAGSGGLIVTGLTESTKGLELQGYVTSDTSTKSSSGVGAVILNAAKKSGSGVGNMGSGANLVAVIDNTTTRAIFAQDGDLYLDTVTNINHWDDYDDIQLLHGMRALFVPDGHDLKARFGQFMEDAREVLEKTGVVHFNDDGHHFIATKKLQMLTIDALRQAYERLDQRITKLEAHYGI